MRDHIEVLRGLADKWDARAMMPCYDTAAKSAYETAAREFRAALAAMAAQAEAQNPVEALRDIAEVIAEDIGLEVDHASFDAAGVVMAQPEAQAGGGHPGPDWRSLYQGRHDVISRWHDRAVALGYDGVEDLLSLALPCIVNNAGDERTTPPPGAVPQVTGENRGFYREDFLALARFADEIIGDGDHGEWDGYEIEQAAIRAGLIVQVEKTVPCCGSCACMEFADDGEKTVCNNRTPSLVRAIWMARHAAPGPKEDGRG